MTAEESTWSIGGRTDLKTQILTIIFNWNPIQGWFKVDLDFIFSLLSLFWKNKSMLMRSSCCACLCVSLLSNLNAWTNLYETWYAYHGTWAHLNGILHKSPFVCMFILLSLLGNGCVKTLPRQRIEKLLGASFSMWSVSYKRKVGDWFFSELLVFFRRRGHQKNRTLSC
jgi:hypothetical protein